MGPSDTTAVVTTDTLQYCFLFCFRWQKGKMLLLASLSAWIIFTLPLGFIQPPATSCILKENHTYIIKSPEAPEQKMYKREVDNSALFLLSGNDMQKQETYSRNTRSYHQTIRVGQSPLNVKFASNYDERQHSGLVSPLFSSIVYRTEVCYIVILTNSLALSNP